MKKLSDIFDIFSGSNLDFNKLQIDDNGINFVSRNSNDNGVIGKVLLVDGMKIFKKGDITVPLNGTYLLSAFVQNADFVTAQNVKVLRAKQPMADLEKWFYCYVLRENRFRFASHGREVNKYIKDILVPDEIPAWVYSANIAIEHGDNSADLSAHFNTEDWKRFYLKELFDIKAGKYHYTSEYEDGETPYISACNKNNGISSRISLEADFLGNCITIGKIGCEAFYQSESFCATSDVNILCLKSDFGITLNQYIGIFIASIINFNENYKWSYGRQCRVNDAENIVIKLPVTGNGLPDWQYMEDYIKSLPYGDCI